MSEPKFRYSQNVVYVGYCDTWRGRLWKIADRKQDPQSGDWLYRFQRCKSWAHEGGIRDPFDMAGEPRRLVVGDMVRYLPWPSGTTPYGLVHADAKPKMKYPWQWPGNWQQWRHRREPHEAAMVEAAISNYRGWISQFYNLSLLGETETIVLHRSNLIRIDPVVTPDDPVETVAEPQTANQWETVLCLNIRRRSG